MPSNQLMALCHWLKEVIFWEIFLSKLFSYLHTLNIWVTNQILILIWFDLIWFWLYDLIWRHWATDDFSLMFLADNRNTEHYYRITPIGVFPSKELVYCIIAIFSIFLFFSGHTATFGIGDRHVYEHHHRELDVMSWKP